MSVLLWILLATIINSLVAFVGALFLGFNDKLLHKILFYLVAFSAGALLTGAFFHLLAESLEHLEVFTAFSYLFVGFIIFFLLEKGLHWHHCHEHTKCKVHPMTKLILVGDGVHNFIDGLIIAASFLIDIRFGIITTIMIFLHEVPQELGDFGILIYGGWDKLKALYYNFASQIMCIIGGLIGFFFATDQIRVILLPFAAGGFIYIAASDLIPELHKQPELKKSLLSFIFFLVGVGLLLGLKYFGG